MPTSGEIKVEDVAMRLRKQQATQAREAIVAACGGHWVRGMVRHHGEIECPVCRTGRLRFSRSGYNGHIYAGCTTPDCVRWMD